MFDLQHIHPMVVHFPIALILVGFLADFVFLLYRKEACLHKTGFYLMFLGALAALVAFLTGEFLTSHPEEGEIMGVFKQHEIGAWITLISILIGIILRITLQVAGKMETSLRWAVLAVYFIAFGAVSFTGYIGGSMVYNFMVGL
jgi:uncharacterized membrane protein